MLNPIDLEAIDGGGLCDLRGKISALLRRLLCNATKGKTMANEDDDSDGAGCDGPGVETHTYGGARGELDRPEVQLGNSLEIIAAYEGGEPFDGIAIVRTISSRTEQIRVALRGGKALLDSLLFAGPHVVQACYSDGTVVGSTTVSIGPESRAVITVRPVSE